MDKRTVYGCWEKTMGGFDALRCGLAEHCGHLGEDMCSLSHKCKKHVLCDSDLLEELEREVETLRTACAEKDGVMAFVECAFQAFFSLSSTERKALSDNWMLTVARKLEEGIALSPASVQEQAEYARIGRAVSNTDWVRNASDEAFLEKMRPGYTLALKHLQAVIEQARKGERRG